MESAAWFLYGGLFVVGIVFWMLRSTERFFETVSLPQIFYLMYMLTFALFAGRVLRDRSLMMTFLLPALGLMVWLVCKRDPDILPALRRDLQEEIDGLRQAHEKQPSDPILMEALGDAYIRIGAAGPAAKYFTRLRELYAGKPAADRLRLSVQEKLDSLAREGAIPPKPEVAEVIGACPGCESVVSRLVFACPRCGRQLFPDKRLWHAVRFNRIFERYGLTHMTAFGILFIPLLHICGPLPYGLLWLVWTLAFARYRNV